METRTLEIVGRGRELAAIDALLDGASAHGRSALLLEGPAGVGKTTLCSTAAEVARERGFETLAARAVEAEAELALATIGDLLEPVLHDALPELPEPQARALRVALLLEDGPTPTDARALGVATHGVLRLVSSRSPVLVVVDDLQWLDASSAAAIRFAARRLGRHPVVFLFSRREGHADGVVPSLQHVQRVSVSGLSSGALHRLVRDRLGLVLTLPALRRLRELSAGNPFYALELGSAFQRGAIRLERGEPLPPTLEALVGERIADLGPETREALAAAAALNRPTFELVGSADVLAPAAEADVIRVYGEELTFTHPLLASAAYAALDEERRRGLHRRLAAVVDDAEERARHLALATVGCDEAVASELERAALTARARGAVAAAADLAERALRATAPEDHEATHRRTLLATRHRFESGDGDWPRRMLERLVDATPPGPRRAEALADLARVHHFEGTRHRAVDLLRDALDECGDDLRLRAVIEERLTSALIVLRENLGEAAAHARTAVAQAETLGDSQILARTLSAHGLVGGVFGYDDAVAALERAAELEAHAGYFVNAERAAFNLAVVLMWSDELESARERFAAFYGDTADDGDEGSLAWTADNLGSIEFLLGNWDEALRWTDAGEELAVQTGQPGQQAYARSTKALVHAHKGDVEAARAAAIEALELSRDEVAIGWINGRWALGTLELSLGNAAEAHELLEPLCEHAEREGVGEPGVMRFLFDDVEALVVAGDVDRAARRLAHIEGHARRLDRAFALAASARCRGLISSARGETSAGLEAFERALAEHARVSRPFDRARTLLAYGGALRRSKRKRQARDVLEQAASEFRRLGAAIWLERATDELARIGGRTSAGDELTPTERRVAELAAQGLANREIANTLFVSPKTVEFHLRNVFRKLGVRSRTELARRTP